MSRALKYLLASASLVAFNFSVVTSRTVVAQDQDLADHVTVTCNIVCDTLYGQLTTFQQYAPCKEICSSLQSQTTSATAPTTTTTKSATTTTTTATTQPRVRTDIEPSCGQHQILSNRIVGGSQADECEFPWVVSVTIPGYSCGGTIVDKRHVITAAHCLYLESDALVQPHEVKVYVGSSSRRNLTTYGVVEFFSNPNYNSTFHDYDIAVLVLAEELTYSKCVAPVCLPVASTRVMEGEVCVAAGWGLQAIDKNGVPYLKKVSLPIVNNDVCLQIYGNFNFNDLKLCAGYYYEGTCHGDSGGPLMCLDQDRWVLRGVTSFRAPSCYEQTVFTRTAHPNITSFIDESLARPYPKSSSTSELDLVMD